MNSIRKQPWLAVNLSLFFPGFGQIYAGKILRGAFFTVIYISLIATFAWSVFSPAGNTVNGIRCLLPILIVYVASLIDAYVVSLARRRYEITSTRKDPWFAVFLSQILPGLGHLYIEKTVLGAILLIVTVIVASVANVFVPLLIFTPFVWAIACYHAYVASPTYEAKSPRWIAIIAVATVVLRLIFSYLPFGFEQYVEIFVIPSNSMLPTLQINDRMFVRKSSNYIPKSGDVIVFEPPPKAQLGDTNNQTEEVFVKRVIGAPGQVVEVKNGQVYLNQQPLQEGYIAEQPFYQWGPVAVPHNSYFVLGDNRNNSFDSHVWDFLPSSNIIGRAYKIYWPPERSKPL